MPDSHADTGPQVEDGYTRYANELLEALCKLRCTNAERRLIDAIARLTYGVYGRKKADLGLSKLVEVTALRKDAICIARRALCERGILIVFTGQNKNIPTYSINKHYKRWKPFTPAKKILRGQKDILPEQNGVLAGQNRTLLEENNNKTKRKNSEPAKKKPALPPNDLYKNVIEYLNAMIGAKYSYESKTTRASIRARWREGYTEKDMKDVIKVKCDQWLGDRKTEAWLRPDTLFRPTKFEAYYQEARRSKKALQSERQRIKERTFKIAAGILRESGQRAALRYCMDNKIEAEEFKQWTLKNTGT